ncbi:MAG: AAA family ATPase [Nanoarchaeota archaeon]|nr:AAA family ATPase [Nanoarchaeota archaeon]
MKLRKITLNNIRSYKQQEVEFLDGSTLLSGDIGSGKTSILLGIEFALFGLQPGQRGSSLLRNGEDQGGVSIEFEVDGKEIIVERTLKRGKAISQNYCSITLEGEKKEISVSELKSKVLELLDYPTEFAKKQNILYKFTVYTPQEEMKQIILQDPTTRLNTLRHVFGIDKYKRVLENASLVTLKMREEKRMKQGLTANLESDKSEIVTKENELETKYYNLASVEKEFFLKTENRKKIQEEKQEISKKIEEKNKLHQEIEKTKIIISNKKESIANNKRTIAQINEKIKELDALRFEESEISRLEQEVELNKNEIQTLNEENLQITSKITSLNIKNKENEIIKDKLVHIEICPTCMQDVDPVYKNNVLNKINSNLSENINQIEILSLNKKNILEKINKTNSKISLGDQKIRTLNLIKIQLQTILEKQNSIKEIEKSDTLLEQDVTILTKHIDGLRKSVLELNKFDNLFEIKQKELEQALNQEKMTEIKTAELKKEIEVFSKQIEELNNKIKKTEEIKKQLNHLTELENWINQKFIALISHIENNVMTKLKTEFSKLFEEWFCMLVSDSFNVRLGDDFTPIIEHQDYEIDYAYLSGGERTAVALAYRLSLNQVINSLLSKIKTRDLVILDEPTDGFSDQQLDKMRDVLQQLNVAQLIIVSHEQKIESFVENVLKFKKEDGISIKEE